MSARISHPPGSAGAWTAALFAAAGAVWLAQFLGLVSIVGVEWNPGVRSAGMTGAGWRTTRWAMSAWLDEGDALRADVRVRAPYGSVAVRVHPMAPPTLLPGGATAFVAGDKAGGILFVAPRAGMYNVRSDPGVLGGRISCPEESATIAGALLPGPDCPTYDVSFRVVWRRIERLRVASAPGVLARTRIPPLGSRGEAVVVR